MSWYSKILTNSNQKIAIIGMGLENQQFLNWLLQTVKINPNRLIVADVSGQPSDFLQEILEKNPSIKSFFGANYLDCLNPEIQPQTNPQNDEQTNQENQSDSQVGWVFKAPGVWSLKPEIVSFSKRVGVGRVHSSLLFFLEACKNSVIAITGTKGKTTTSSFAYHLLKTILPKKDNKMADEIHYCGNSSNVSPYQFWQKKPPLNHLFVLELSSFQLQDLDFAQISAHTGVITNYFVDHQDQHASVEEYWQAKDTLLKYQTLDDFAVVSDQIMDKTSLDFTHKNCIILDQKMADDLVFQTLQANPNLPGKHNIKNIAQAVYAVANLVLSADSTTQKINQNICDSWILSHKEGICGAINSFQPVPHRLCKIYTLNHTLNFQDSKTASKNIKINFWDDGAATEPDAVEAGVSSLFSSSSLILLQLAGVDKGGDLDNCIKTIQKGLDLGYIWGVLGTGSVAKNFQQKASFSFSNNISQTLHECVSQNYVEFLKQAILSTNQQNKDTIEVIFSPSGSSFDEFKSYSHRSDWWVEEIKEIAKQLANK